MPRLVHFIDTLPHAPYTESTICRRRKCGSAVQIGRGPATVIGKTVAVSQAALRSCSGRSFFARKSQSDHAPASCGAFFWCESCRTLVDASFWYRLPFPRHRRPPFFSCASLPCGPRRVPGPRRQRARLMKSSTRWAALFESPLRFQESSRLPRVSPKRCMPLESRTALSATPSTATILPTRRKRAR